MFFDSVLNIIVILGVSQDSVINLVNPIHVLSLSFSLVDSLRQLPGIIAYQNCSPPQFHEWNYKSLVTAFHARRDLPHHHNPPANPLTLQSSLYNAAQHHPSRLFHVPSCFSNAIIVLQTMDILHLLFSTPATFPLFQPTYPDIR